MIDGPLIQTASGAYVAPFTPWSWLPEIADVAHALSNLCRYTGHCARFYSVAEHSVRVADTLPAELRLAGLLHDASEAYLGDVARPLKHHGKFGKRYRIAERRLQQRIDHHFGVATDQPEIHHADLVLLATEKRDLMPPGPDWALLANIEALGETITPWSPARAHAEFILHYRSLSAATLAVA